MIQCNNFSHAVHKSQVFLDLLFSPTCSLSHHIIFFSLSLYHTQSLTPVHMILHSLLSTKSISWPKQTRWPFNRFIYFTSTFPTHQNSVAFRVVTRHCIQRVTLSDQHCQIHRFRSRPVFHPGDSF